MGISYRYAWNYIRKLEKRLGIKIVKSERGGSGGGATILTDAGKTLVREYEKLYEFISKALNKYELYI